MQSPFLHALAAAAGGTTLAFNWEHVLGGPELRLVQRLAHSILISPAQLVPLPLYPGLHVQLKLPTVFVHCAASLQLWVLVVHSLMSVAACEGRSSDLSSTFACM